jgi:hypothetical protein
LLCRFHPTRCSRNAPSLSTAYRQFSPGTSMNRHPPPRPPACGIVVPTNEHLTHSCIFGKSQRS